jgi:hypothetical protein
MARHQGQRKQQLFFDQVCDSQRPAQDQHVFIALQIRLRIQRGSFAFVRDKPQRSVSHEVGEHWLQTSLALQRHIHFSAYVEPNLGSLGAYSSPLAAHVPTHRGPTLLRCTRVNCWRQAGQLSKRQLAGQQSAIVGENLHV